MIVDGDAAALLGDSGPFAARLTAYHPRPSQQAMARAVETAIEERGCLVCEAGTGTGKTLAYLVPACLGEGPVIVSTGTKPLQEQLFHRDLPLVCRALERPRRLAMLKGRANYLCRYRLERSQGSGQLPLNQQAQIMRIAAWAGRTRSGDIEEVDDVPHDAPVWPHVTSTSENCLGQECPDYDRCHVVEARRRAQKADILVVNHHLLFSDMRLRDEGHGELLPACRAVIVDEAHQLPELASQYFGESISAHRLRLLARDIARCQAEEAPEAGGLGDLADTLLERIDRLRQGLPAGTLRADWRSIASRPATRGRLDELLGCLRGIEDALDSIAERGKGLANCLLRTSDVRTTLERISGEGRDGEVHWFETSPQGFRLHRTPIDCADAFRSQMANYPQAAWVFTSATLAVAGDFGHFASRLGLDDYRGACWPSPFDYPRQALLYLPQGLPDPASGRAYHDHVIATALPVLTASGGRAFFLFTSHQALRNAAARLRAEGLPFPLLVQGEGPRGHLLQRFRELGNAVLLGTASFWEGIDVRGEALSCVIIDKLPFASPDDPVFQARSAHLRSNGGNPFRDLQIPQAVIALKQGAGRLIRDENDRGVLVICDPRLHGRPYGRAFLRDLPPMRPCRDLATVEAFFAHTGHDALDKEGMP